jgi:hypothetical protein
LAADLVDRKADVIVAAGPPSARAAKNATSTIPIVFSSGDPVGGGLIAGLARPGGNLTGVSLLTVELMAKRLELLSEVVPPAGVIALLVNPNDANAERIIRDLQEAARAKGVQLPVLKAGTENEIDAVFSTLVQRQVGGLVVGTDPFFNSRREQLMALASRHAVPAIYEWREFAAAGGLTSYGTSLIAVYRQGLCTKNPENRYPFCATLDSAQKWGITRTDCERWGCSVPSDDIKNTTNQVHRAANGKLYALWHGQVVHTLSRTVKHFDTEGEAWAYLAERDRAGTILD